MPKLDYAYSDPSGSFVSGQTPYGTYDADSTFQTDILSVTKWVAKRLGYPVLQLEMPSGSIYACFEESINEYSYHINNYNIKNWMWEQYGEKNRISGSLGTGSLDPVVPTHGPSITLSEKYGQAVNMGGNVDLKKGYITLSGSNQDYDLQDVWASVSESNKRIEVQRVFNHAPSSITRFYDPYAGSFDQQQMLDTLGSIISVITFAVAALGGISLLVGGVGIFTIMTIAVRERTHEIGLLRAIGAPKYRITQLFLGEAMVLAGLGGAGGLLLAITIVVITTWIMPNFPAQIPLLYASLSEITAVTIGVAAGLMPARRAASLVPLEALRAG